MIWLILDYGDLQFYLLTSNYRILVLFEIIFELYVGIKCKDQLESDFHIYLVNKKKDK